MKCDAPHLLLPDSAREAMRVPLGPVISTPALEKHVAKDDLLVTVGDMVTLTALDTGYCPNLSVFDYKTKRDQERDFKHRLRVLGGEWVKVSSPPAALTQALWDVLEGVFSDFSSKTRFRIEIDGEEDLAAIPCILWAPDGTRLLYGMPDRGMVVVTVDKTCREQARALLGLFERRNGWDRQQP